MHKGWLYVVFIFFSCTNHPEEKVNNNPNHLTVKDSFLNNLDTGRIKLSTDRTNENFPASPYSNERFRNVQATRLAEQVFRITGQAQIFEARFGWVLEDGHNELASGFESTTAGAPAWGNFSFTVKVPVSSADASLHILLFENSAKDGSRLYTLPIPLP